MYPALRDGDLCLVDRDAYADDPPQPGDIVCARHPFRTDLVIAKRVARLTADGRVFLVGEDPIESGDSRGFGPIARDRILGKVIGKGREPTGSQ